MATPKPAKAPNPHSAIADELGALEKEMAPHAQKLARIEQLRKTLRAECPVANDHPWTVNGQNFVAVLGPRALERSISTVALVRAIGAAAFARFATCTLKSLEASVAPAIAASVITSDHTGSRSLKTFEKGAA